MAGAFAVTGWNAEKKTDRIIMNSRPVNRSDIHGRLRNNGVLDVESGVRAMTHVEITICD